MSHPEPTNADRIKLLEARISAAMAEVNALFVLGVKVTMLIRRPDDDRADICCTDDEFPDLIAMLHRCQARDEGRTG